MDDGRTRNTGRLAVAIGLVAAGSACSLATYFVVRGPFGTINDIGNATVGILSACLAWRMRDQLPGRGGAAAVGLALGGAAVAVTGSAMVISGSTSYVLAGLVSSVGFAGVGAWLLALSRSGASATWSSRLRLLGVAAGALMAVGVVALPGVAMRIDDFETMPSWLWIAYIGWLGIFVVYPAWALWFGAREARLGSGTPVLGTGTSAGESASV
jgi:hypothetical protein